MLWSLLKIVVFLAIAALLAFAAVRLLETPGEVNIAFDGREFQVTPIGFVVGLVVLVVLALIALKVLGFLAAVARFLLGDETAITRYFTRNRERRGLDALSGSMLALASGEPALAARKAAKAEKLLQRPEVALVKARAAEMTGDRKTALASYASLLANDRTRFAGVNGAMRLKLEAGETDTALELARKAFALRPDNAPVLDTLFDLQTKTGDWAGARETLNAKMHARLMPRDLGTRRDAVLSLAESRKAHDAGDAARGHAAALQASKLAPTLAPASTLAAQAHLSQGSKRRATRALVNAWTANPHPEIAAAFAAIEPGESPAARRKRFQTLTAAAPNHPESRLLAAELALADEDFPGARKALGDLPEADPTARSLAIMAAIERGQGAPDAEVRGWLAKALGAPRGAQWICAKCNHVHSAWVPVCENCGGFDTLDWKTPPHAQDAGLAQSAMLPLIIGAAPRPAPEAAEPPARPDGVEDAEVSAASTA